MAARNLVVLLAAVCSGCLLDVDANGILRITVVGDSNSAVLSSRTSWVEYIQNDNLLPQVHALKDGVETLEDVEWGNSAIVGWACVNTLYGVNSGLAWTNQAIAHNTDAIVVAAGTNDLEAFDATPQDIANCYSDMQTAAAMANVAMFIATTPPVYPPYPDADYWNGQTSELNALVRTTFDSKLVIDFDTGFTSDMYLDSGNGRHLNDVGELLRAQRVATVIKAAQDLKLADRCPSAPLICRPTAQSVLFVKHNADDTKDMIVWKWIKGTSTNQSEFGDPTTTADYALCIYAGTASTLVGQSVIPASATKWSALITRGYRYHDPAAAADGITNVSLDGSDQNRSKVLVKGKGANLPVVPLPAAAPVTVQLVNGGNGLCWGTSYTDAQLVRNDPTQLRAKAP